MTLRSNQVSSTSGSEATPTQRYEMVLIPPHGFGFGAPMYNSVSEIFGAFSPTDVNTLDLLDRQVETDEDFSEMT